MNAALDLQFMRADFNPKLSAALGRPIRTAWLSPDNARFGLSGEPLEALAGRMPIGKRYRQKYIQALGAFILAAWTIATTRKGDGTDPSVCIPRSDRAFRYPSRYHVNDIGYRPWIGTLDWLSRQGFLTSIGGGFRGAGHFAGIASTYQATDKLQDWVVHNKDALQETKFIERTEPLRLTSKTADGKRLIDYTDTDVTRVRRQQIETINTVNQRHAFEIPAMAGNGLEIVSPFRLEARRTFRDDFTGGGRMSLSLQCLKKDQRRQLRIDGSPVVELDYRSHQPRMLYHLRGIEAPSDCYGDDPGLRGLMKAAMVRVMNCQSHRQALGALGAYLGQTGLPEQHQGLTSKQLLEMVFALHPLIKDAMSVDLWKRLQYLESCIAAGIMESLARADRPCLGIHDSFVVKEQDTPFLQGLMVSEYRKHMGGFEPIVTQA